MTRLWNNYWFARPGSLSVAVIRIGLGLSMLMAVRLSCPESFADYIAAQNPALYNPWGILAWFGREIPSPAFFEFFRKLAILSSFTLILGLYSRTSLVVCTISGLLTLPFQDSFQQSWSHSDNVLLLTFIAMAFVRCGDRLSVDSILNDISGRGISVEKAIEEGKSYFYGVLLAQFSVTTMFLNAGFWKLRHGGRYLGWALSDNMRNLLIGNRLVLGEDLPWHLHWIVMREWAYKGLAFGNLFGQITPFLAMFFIRRPLLRALCGLAFCLEFLGLGIIMRIWVWQWIPLIVVFVDWDALYDWSKSRVYSMEKANVAQQSVTA